MAKFKIWSQEEKRILETYYIEEGGKKIQARLPGKSLSQIYAYASYLGLQYNQKNRKVSERARYSINIPYSEAETEAVATYYPDEGSKMHKRIPPRSKASVSAKAQRMGVRYKNRKPWTAEETARVEQLVTQYGLEAACSELNRSYSSIASFCCRHDIQSCYTGSERHWTDEDLHTLEILYPSKGAAYTAKVLNRSVNGIKKKWYKITKKSSKIAV